MSTYGLPAEITAQTLFDKVTTHLFTQGRPSFTVNKDGQETITCGYRGKDGRACAAGCLIPDDRVNDDMEGKTVEHEIVLAAMPEFEPHTKMLFDLQRVHDVYASREQDRGYIRASLVHHLGLVAERYGLNRDAIDAQMGA